MRMAVLAIPVLMVTFIQARLCLMQNVKRRLDQPLDVLSIQRRPVPITGMIGNWPMDLITLPQRPVGKGSSK